jgi:inner membrane protein
MSPITHFFTGWVLSSAAGLDRRSRAVASFACVAPDLDGLGIVPEMLTRGSKHPLLWFSEYHHDLHTLLFALIVSLFVLAFCRSWLLAVIAFASFHVHLLEDLVGSRGPDGYAWPIPYLFPFSARGTWVWGGQWQLNAWPNIALTFSLVMVSIWIGAARGITPVELFSRRADQVVVAVIRKRLKDARKEMA